MWKIGLTGSIATGKSTALEAFADLGVPVFSSDAAVHDLYRGEAVPLVGQLFPGVIINGEIDRQKLSAALLADSARLSELEAVVHPLVRKRISAFLANAEQKGSAIAVVDIPLLYEGGFDYGLDRVIVTVVDEATQRRRVLARPGMNVEKLDAILARQMSQDEKRKRADYVFDTSGPIERTRGEVAALVAALRANPKA
ncbi:MAG TPA: dephospho-CoA kinase [Devosia sp.]|nr:dephospho-CoA kinase [Devosia sp.]